MKQMLSSRRSIRSQVAGTGCAVVAWLLSAGALGAQTVLIDESFEEKSAGSYPPATGWTTVDDNRTGWFPTITTNVYDTGHKSVYFPYFTDSLYSPELDVADVAKVILTFRVKQVAGVTYQSSPSLDQEWYNDDFDVSASYDGGTNNLVLKDYGLAEGYVGSYTGTPIVTEKVGGVATGDWYTYELKIDVAQASTLKLRFRWWYIDKTSVRKGYLDTVKVVTIPKTTMVVVY